MSGTDLPPGAFAKQDAGDDLAFYAPPRLVMHIDEVAVAALTGFYRDVLPDGGRVLDLMSSWVSHLPPDRTYGEVVGHGMNAEELAAPAARDGELRRGAVLRRRAISSVPVRGVRGGEACVGAGSAVRRQLRQPLLPD